MVVRSGRDGETVRRPDGVVLDVPPAVPPIVGYALDEGVVALKEPLDDAAVVRLVRALTDAWEKQSLEALTALLATDVDPAGGPGAGGRAALTDAWRQQLQAHDYKRLAGLELVRPERLERWDYESLGLSRTLARPPEMRPDDLYVRAPIEVTHAAGERLFGDFFVLLLRREGRELRIVAYAEADAR
jgi:hypothetical protein